MELVDRYIYAVTKRLSENTRDEVAEELRANIGDMLPENPSDADIKKVLITLGNPIKLAGEYSNTKRYLIGPSIYDSYISTLKLVIVIVACTFAGIALFSSLSDYMKGYIFDLSIITKLFVNMIGSAFEGCIQAFLWVTLVFVTLERTGCHDIHTLSDLKKDWSPEDLPDIPENFNPKAFRRDVIAEMIFTIPWLAILIFSPKVLAYYKLSEGKIISIIPVFDLLQFKLFILPLIFVAIFSFGISCMKIITGRWTMIIAILNSCSNVLFCVIICIMMASTTLWNEDFLISVGNIFNNPLSQTSPEWISIKWGFAAIFIIISVFDSVFGFIKAMKMRKNN